jgi:ABC-2 type transport system ATP-binding protein
VARKNLSVIPKSFMTMKSECLSCSSVSMSYGRKKVLSSCSLLVAPGEVVGLVGENGAGKTTLMKGLLGFLPIDSGTVTITAPVGFCPQENILNGSLTVGEHFRFFDAIQRRRSFPDPTYREKLLQETGLEKFLSSPISELSGGTYQKVKFVTTIRMRPRLLVLDEPCDGFDWQMYLLFWTFLKDLASAGTGVLMVSHLLHDRERFHRIYNLKEGGLEESL